MGVHAPFFHQPRKLTFFRAGSPFFCTRRRADRAMQMPSVNPEADRRGSRKVLPAWAASASRREPAEYVETLLAERARDGVLTKTKRARGLARIARAKSDKLRTRAYCSKNSVRREQKADGTASALSCRASSCRASSPRMCGVANRVLSKVREDLTYLLRTFLSAGSNALEHSFAHQGGGAARRARGGAERELWFYHSS